MHDDSRGVVVFSGGGTGGHLYPALALASALVTLRPDVRPFFVGSERGLESRVLAERGVEHVLLPVRGFARGGALSNWRTVSSLGQSLRRVMDLFRTLAPELVVVTGGYASGPAGIAAALGARSLGGPGAEQRPRSHDSCARALGVSNPPRVS